MKSILTAMLLLLAPLASLTVSAKEETISECRGCTTAMVDCGDGRIAVEEFLNGQPCWRCCIGRKCPLFFCFFLGVYVNVLINSSGYLMFNSLDEMDV